MIAFLTLIYVAVLALLIYLKILPNKPLVWGSTLGWVVLLFIVLFIPMQWGAPSGSAKIMTYSVQIIPNVSGPVIEVPVRPNVQLKKGDILFKIDPALFEAELNSKKSELAFQELRLKQYAKLASSSAGTQFQVEQTQAQVDKLKGQVAAAEWNLKETVVLAPSDGYVTYLALRPGQRVTNLPFQPAATFIDNSRLLVGAQIHQIYVRYLKIGQLVEIAFKTRPGLILTGKIEAILKVSSEGQVVISGTVPAAETIVAQPFFIRIKLDDEDNLKNIPAGTVGTAAIYTEASQMTHIIRKVMLRMESFINYLKPSL